MFYNSKVIRILFLFALAAFLFSCAGHNHSDQNEQIDNQYEFVITVISGNFQHGNNGDQLNDPIVVRVIDSQQTHQANVPLVFEIICGGGRLSITETNTDSSGQAEVSWVLGYQSDHILKVSSTSNQYAAEARYVYANTYFALESQWISGINFRIGYETIPHDDRILETNNFLTFSDASSDDAKVIYSKMAENAFYEIKQAFGIQTSEEIGIFSNDSSTKITIYSNKYLEHDYLAFPFGFFIYGLDLPDFSNWLNSDPGGFREWYKKTVKHESMHVVEFLLGLGQGTIPFPEFWFSEGLSEHISGGSTFFPLIENMDQVNEWLRDPGHINPVSIHQVTCFPIDSSRWGEYYPMFGLAVRYLLDQNGLGKTFLDVKAMYLDMLNTKSFHTSFETYMGMSVEYYQENFFDLISDFLTRKGSD